MSAPKLTIEDYPLAERRPELVTGKRGRSLSDITLEALITDQVTLEDLSITKRALHQQAEIARDAGRATLAQNFERAADLVEIPQETIMRVYDLLRPGRANSKIELQHAADELERHHGAAAIATFIREAADVYERRGLFRKRY